MEATLFRLVLALKTKCFATEARIQEQRSLTPAEFNGLLALKRDVPLSSGEFAKKTGLSVSRASRVGTLLMKKGAVTLQQNDRDRRGIFVKLTKKGLELKKSIEADLVRCEKALLSKMSAGERKQVTASLRLLIDTMQ